MLRYATRQGYAMLSSAMQCNGNAIMGGTKRCNAVPCYQARLCNAVLCYALRYTGFLIAAGVTAQPMGAMGSGFLNAARVMALQLDEMGGISPIAA